MKTSQKILAVLALVGGLALTAQAQVIGSWQGSTAEGWIDWGGSQPSLSTPPTAARYSFAPGVVAGYGQSLKITQPGYNQDLAIKLEYTPGDMAAFFDNHLLSSTFSVPDAASARSADRWVFAALRLRLSMLRYWLPEPRLVQPQLVCYRQHRQ